MRIYYEKRMILLLVIGILFYSVLISSITVKAKEGFAETVLEVSTEGPEIERISLDIDAQGNLGPAGFTLIDQNDILILDTVKQRVQRYKQGLYCETLSIGIQDDYTHIETDGSTVYLFGRSRLLCIDLESKKAESFAYPEKELGEVIGWTFCVNGRIILQSEQFGNYLFDKEQKEFQRTGDGFTCERVGETDGGNKLGDRIKVTANGQTWIFEAENIFMDVLGTSRDGYLYMAVTDANLTVADADYCTIRKYDRDSKEISRCSIDASAWAYYPRHYAEFGPDGNLYVMCVYEAQVLVYRIASDLTGADIVPQERARSVRQKMTDFEPEREIRAGTHNPQAVSISRAAAQTRALNMKNYTWTFKSGHDAWNPDTSAPVYLNNHKNSGQMPCSETGIPYCWAGFNTMYTVTDDGEEVHYSFPATVVQTLSNGKMKYVTGNISSTTLSNTIGVDCTGFASGVYGFSNLVYSATFLSNTTHFTTIQKTQARRMDCFVRSGHVFLFYQWENQLTGQFKTIECTTASNGFGEKDKVLCRSLNINSLSNEYICRRPNAWHNCNHQQIATSYSYDTTQHWKACLFCDYKTSLSSHSFVLQSNGTYKCSVCHYITGTPVASVIPDDY